MQNKGDNRQVFPEHLPLSVIQKGLKSGKYLQGSFMASRENYLEGSVMVQGVDEPVSRHDLLLFVILTLLIF